jgi:hypothetical protein
MAINPSASSQGSASEQQFLPSVYVDGVGDLGNFDKFSGGDNVASITKYRPGGMGPEITYTSLPVYDDVTVTRVYVAERDSALIADLTQQVGRIYGSVMVQPLGADGSVLAISPTTYYGRLASVKRGNADSTSGAPRMYDITFAIESVSN